MKVSHLFLLVFLVFTVQTGQAQNLDSLIQTDDFRQFLVKAKINTYASGDESKKIKLKDGGIELNFSEENLSYRDRYYGETHFTGEEVVFQNDVSIWTMNYYGAVDLNQEIPKNFSDFLNKSLRQVTPSNPFRGLPFFREGDLTYVNEVQGNIINFHGVEKIFYKDIEIYVLYYHGGILKH